MIHDPLPPSARSGRSRSLSEPVTSGETGLFDPVRGFLGISKLLISFGTLDPFRPPVLAVAAKAAEPDCSLCARLRWETACRFPSDPPDLPLAVNWGVRGAAACAVLDPLQPTSALPYGRRPISG
jgi:hypothetical protein